MLNLKCSFDGKDFKPVQNIEEKKINAWTSFFTTKLANNANSIKIMVSIASNEAWYLSVDRRLLPIEKEVVPPFPVGCLLVIRQNDQFYQIDLPKYPHMKFMREEDFVSVSFVVKELSGVGLAFWGKDKVRPSDRPINLKFSIYKIDTLDECVWIEPYPNGAKSAICLTDHADWDSSEKLRQLVNLFEKYDFNFTKSIFPHSDPEGYKNEPGLDDLEFKQQVDRLSAMGTEIAYHGLSPRVNPPVYDECLHRIDAMKVYSPETWIDHGTGNYLYSRDATFSNGVGLVELMKKNAIKNYWSYMDVWENPSDNLNIWAERTLAGSLKDVWGLSMKKGKMKPKQFAYIAVGILKNIFGGSHYRQLKKMYKPSVYKKLTIHAKRLKLLHQNSFVMYDENGHFALNSTNRNWVFDTILLNHLALQLKPKAIDSLVKENGLLLAHCYMGAQHKYGGSNCFNEDSQNPKILKEFEENIVYISKLQDKGGVVTLSFEELRKSYVDFIETTMVREKSRWIITGNAVVVKMSDWKIK